MNKKKTYTYEQADSLVRERTAHFTRLLYEKRIANIKDILLPPLVELSKQYQHPNVEIKTCELLQDIFGYITRGDKYN